MLFRTGRKLSADEARDLLPARSPGTEVREEGADLLITLHRTPGRLARTLSLFFTLPATRTTRLDTFGARVWNMCDGRTPVRDIAGALARDHGWPSDRAEQAVLAFLHQLSERNLIGFGVP
jgi:hypothetical protein